MVATTNIHNLTAMVEAILELIADYEEGENINQHQHEILEEIADRSKTMLGELETMADRLGTAYSVLSAAIDLPQCSGCKCSCNG